MTIEELIPSHTENLTRLSRIIGQIEGIKKMMLSGRDCGDILTQLRAVRSAVKAVESKVLEKHLKHCVAQCFSANVNRDEQIADLKKLFDRFDD